MNTKPIIALIFLLCKRLIFFT